MSAATMFDSHTFVKQLTEAGMSVRQAEILAQEQVNLVYYRLATKDDVNQARMDLGKEIECVRTDLTREIESVRTDLTREIESVRTDLTKEIASVRTEVEHVRADLTKEIACVRSDLTHLIEKLESRMVIKLGAMLVIAVTVTANLQRIF